MIYRTFLLDLRKHPPDVVLTATCKLEIANFTSAVSCLPGSNFIFDCSGCQQCILTYAAVSGMNNATETLVQDVQRALKFCLGTSSEPQIVSLESQASRIALLTLAPTSTARVETAVTTAPSATTTGAGGVISNTTTQASIATATSSSTSTGTTVTGHVGSLNHYWIAGPVIGAVLGIMTVFIVLFFARRKYRKQAVVVVSPPSSPSTEFKKSPSVYSLPLDAGKPELHAESVEVVELPNTEIVHPVELPASEPVGSELSSPSDESFDSTEKWQLPLSPLTQLFAMSELRDLKRGVDENKKHDTYYNP